MTTLREDIEALRAIPAEWKRMADPLAELRKIRHGYDPEGDPCDDTEDQTRERALAGKCSQS
jgi:hypothetical protein